MASVNKNSVRQKILNLPIEEMVQFPVAKLKSIRATIGDLQRMFPGLRYTTVTTPTYIKVICIERPKDK